mgnify:FL=1
MVAVAAAHMVAVAAAPRAVTAAVIERHEKIIITVESDLYKIVF